MNIIKLIIIMIKLEFVYKINSNKSNLNMDNSLKRDVFPVP